MNLQSCQTELVDEAPKELSLSLLDAKQRIRASVLTLAGDKVPHEQPAELLKEMDRTGF